MMKPIFSRHINSLLQEYASDTFTPLEQCDFKLLSYSVYIKYPHEESFSKIDSELYKMYQQDINAVLKDKATIYQTYKVTLQNYRENDIYLDYEIQFDTLKVAPQLLIQSTSILPYAKYQPIDFFKILIKEVNKIKAKNNILIDFHHRGMIEDIKKIVQDLYNNKTIDKIKIRLFDGVAPVLSVSSMTLLHFNEKSNKIIKVAQGEILLEYKKPRFGNNGFNCFGHQIDNGQAASGFFDCKADPDSIEVINTNDKIILKAKKDGYIKYDSKSIAVSNVLEIERIKRVESKLTDDEDNKIEVIVSENDITQDSIGEGVELASERIHIKGFVGRNSTLEASELIVGGATHTSSKLFARHAVINRHKGTVRCHRADIKLLEGGIVHATKAHVEMALGGTIYAKEITLGNIKNNLTLYASHSITVRQISGEDNKFTIDYRQIPIVTSELEFIAADLKELNFKLEDAVKTKSDTSKIKDEIQELKERKKKILNSAEEAFIEIQQPVHGLNTITFYLPDKGRITYKTKHNTYERFHLVFKGDTIALAPVGVTKAL